ncbi:MAG: hypothetical protein HY043_23175 [Verrucomicrobia bacterium]|nr:hypothetical protein [Verrucomicrobiota bacterium]
MKKLKHASKTNSSGALRKNYLSTLVVRPLTRRIKQQRFDCIELGKKILYEIQEVNASIEIIAREIARQVKRGK